jgi:hypothetical protein
MTDDQLLQELIARARINLRHVSDIKAHSALQAIVEAIELLHAMIVIERKP